MNRETERNENQEAEEDAKFLRSATDERAEHERAEREAERAALARLKRKCGRVKKKVRK